MHSSNGIRPWSVLTGTEHQGVGDLVAVEIVSRLVDSKDGENGRAAEAQPGIGRLPFWIGVNVAGAGAAGIIVATDGSLDAGVGAIALVVVTSMVLAVGRLRNMGASGWWALGMLVPVLNLLVLARCELLPVNYRESRRLDRTGRILTAAFLVQVAVISLTPWFISYWAGVARAEAERAELHLTPRRSPESMLREISGLRAQAEAERRKMQELEAELRLTTDEAERNRFGQEMRDLARRMRRTRSTIEDLEDRVPKEKEPGCNCPPGDPLCTCL